MNIAIETARLIDLGQNVQPSTALWPESKARDDLILNADGFAQVRSSHWIGSLNSNAPGCGGRRRLGSVALLSRGQSVPASCNANAVRWQVLPKDKKEVVVVLQKYGYVVGMTGDGVNDAPALSQAQIGIAVDGATEAAKAAADIILTTPGLSAIFDAIVESRKIFQRLQAFIL